MYKKLIFFSFALILAFSCLGQEVEFCGSLNSSTEQRFKSAYGIGLQYQHDISQKFKVGLGVHYNFKNTQFTEEAYIDPVPFPPSIKETYSESRRFSIRLNIQGLLRNNENVLISIGPEISYNYLWGKDDINLFVGGSTAWENYTQTIRLSKMIGLGLVSNVEIKNFLTPQLSLCLTLRPEMTTDGEFAKGSQPIFSGILGFVESQIGLKYRFKK